MDVWTIVGYIVAVLFNVGVVVGIRAKVYDSGKRFLQSGRFATLIIFLLCFAELLITGGFEALKSSAAFLALIQQACTMSGAAIAAHGTGKTLLGS